MIRAGIITISDKGFRKEREDLSAGEIEKLLGEIPVTIENYEIIPDEQDMIADKLREYVDDKKLHLVVTTGGTGVSPRDVTPEATLTIIEREIPGMAEVMRYESLKKTPHAMISRSVVGIRKKSLIVNLPGSPQAARENLTAILPALPHALAKIGGDDAECGEGSVP